MSVEAAVKLRLACDDIDVVDLLPRVSVPTLVLHSGNDNAVPWRTRRRLAAAISNARFVALESENHVPLPDEPAWPQFIAEIETFPPRVNTSFSGWKASAGAAVALGE